MIKITTHTSHFRRSINGAWLGNGGTTEVREIPDDADVGAHLHGARTQTVTAEWPDGESVSISYANQPVRGYGWGPFGHLTPDRSRGFGEGVRLHPRVPGWGLGYYGMRKYTSAELATFKAAG